MVTVFLTVAETARAIGAPEAWVRDATRHLPASRSLGRVRIRHADLGRYNAEWRRVRGLAETRTAA